MTDPEDGVGHRPGGAVQELGHHEPGTHGLGLARFGIELPPPGGVVLQVLSSSLDALAMDAQDRGPGALVTERVEDAHVLGC